MKHNSKHFLALFMAATMAVAPVSGVYAEDQNAAVENTVSENGQDSAEAGQTETDANDRQAENSTEADTSQEAVKEAGENQPAAGKVQDTLTAQSGTKAENKEKSAVKNQVTAQNTTKDETALQAETTDEDEIFEGLTDVSGTAGALKDGEYSVDADHFSAGLTSGNSSKVKIECEKVIVKNGKATAWINFSSSNYDKAWVKVNGTQNRYTAKSIEGGSGATFEIPVDLNKAMTFMVHTSSMGGKNIAYTMNITIPEGTVPTTPSAPEQTVITELSFKEGSELSMKAGEVQNLTPVFTPALASGEVEPDVVWTSSDPKVVTVAKSGTQAELTAVKAGTAEVTATITNSEGTEIKTACKVTVTAPETENKTLTDGRYQVNVETNGNGMFGVVNCVMTVKDGKMTAAITLKGKGYNKIYLGSEEDAPKHESEWILPDSLLAERYTFQIPVEKLDEEIQIAAHGSTKWYDKILIFRSEGMTKLSDNANGNDSNGNNGSNGSLTPGGNNSNSGNTSNGNNSGNAGSNNGNTGNTGNNTTNNGKPDKESKYESDLNKSTAKVNSATGLKDGVYTPDNFSWSGGTGKVSISCSKVTVTGGQAYATITFSSTHYQYVKANGNVYYPSSKTGSSTSFVIPVELNKNNTIVGMTTAMSTAHEIKYTIFVYIAEAAKANASARANGKEITVIGANGSDSSKTAAASKKLDEVAPEIIGLEYQSETKAEHAKYFKIYHYDQGITLLEIDMSKKTGRNTAGKKWKETSETSGLNPSEQEQASLYLNKVVKYLIVPENAEIPAGLDKEVIVVRQPADHIYAGTNKTISLMEELDQLDKVTAVGVKKDKCKNETIKEKMEEKEVLYAGKSGKLNYKKLVKNKCNLAILSSSVLPKKGSSKKAAKKKMTAYRKMTEKMTLLEMPVIVDRSKDEKGKDAQKEWEKVYQVILGCDDQSAE